MTAPPASGSPNAELLGVLAEARRLAGERDPARWERMVLGAGAAFLEANVLIGMRDTSPATVPAITGPVLIAVSDPEAADAYHARTPPDGVGRPLSFTPVADVAGTASQARFWIAAFRRTGAASVVFNPAGPLGTIMPPAALAASDGTPRPDRPLALPWGSDRGAARRRDATIVDVYAKALSAQDSDALAQIGKYAHAAHFNVIGSLYTDAIARYLDGLRRYMSGETAPGLAQVLSGATAMADCGFPEQCVDAILDCRAVLLGQARASARQILERLDLARRRDEVEALLR